MWAVTNRSKFYLLNHNLLLSVKPIAVKYDKACLRKITSVELLENLVKFGMIQCILLAFPNISYTQKQIAQQWKDKHEIYMYYASVRCYNQYATEIDLSVICQTWFQAASAFLLNCCHKNDIWWTTLIPRHSSGTMVTSIKCS